ncbi:hydrogenase 4 subunit B [Thermomonas sp.]|uniref:hydrogenase 4 subunit B n=1 Tax=Thermomonas sp. TaxID=1971895 RepID=UPI002489350A|nr:hydrogenase 4 subunit B [Thermomonas sp.]MDI1253690.1 hydrogenase 4 subunit B [Thermomonas sp.]
MPIDLLTAALAVAAGWVLIGLAGLLRPRSVVFTGRWLFSLGVVGGLALAVIGVLALTGPIQVQVLPIGLPDLPFHVRLDPLAAIFLSLIGTASTGISLYSAGYFRAGEGAAPGLMCLQYHVFLASMVMVVLADDAYAFMVAWETMALASYFLVTTQHRVPEIRAAGFLYLLLAHIGAIGILLCFGVLQGGSWQFTFDAMRAASLSPAWASIAFFLALFGFGAKAGIVPLHVWLPEAHPAAPSPVSALMSGVMIKTAIYGLIRVTFDLLHTPVWWWGVVALMLGAFTALFGVVFAAVQTDMKRLLAYSSIENSGIILSGFGLTVLFHGLHMPVAASLTMAATLYHCLNHSLFKSLLFLATGSVLHATGERNLGKLGGLIHSMPWVAWLALVGTLAMAGLPPLNGFVSEWLLLQGYLYTTSLPHAIINMLVPIGAAAFTLTIALSAYVMVKFYGVVFLGRPREKALVQAQDAGWLERFGLGWLALGCIALGLMPVTVLRALDAVNLSLLGSGLGDLSKHWWLLTPTAASRASYSPLAFAAGILLAVALTFLCVRLLYHGRVRRADFWDCGFPGQTARVQDTAEGFGQPIRRIFRPFFQIERQSPSPFDSAPHYALQLGDRWWYWLYLPVAAGVLGVAKLVGRLQHGRIAIYLLYSFVTLLALLVFVL